MLHLTGFASHGTVIAIALNRLFGLLRIMRLNKKALMTPTEALGLCVMLWFLAFIVVIPTPFYEGTEFYNLYIPNVIGTTLIIGSYFYIGLLIKRQSENILGSSHNEKQDLTKVPKNLVAFIVAYLLFTVLPLLPLPSLHSSFDISLLIITKEEGVDFFSVLCCHSW